MLLGCSNSADNSSHDEDSATGSMEPRRVAVFNADSAYEYIKAQCDMGPRVPGTAAHERCAQWLQGRLQQSCDTVYVQRGNVTTFDGKTLNITNLIGSINPDSQYRLLLVAHWDCRPWADNDADAAKRTQPVMGANDAASGVAVLLELARTVPATLPSIGIDFLFVDAEDWGEDGGDEDSWALGTQYWAANPHIPGYNANAGILLDMVGAEGAQFSKEYFSMMYARKVVDDVWRTAAKCGYGSYFTAAAGAAITDDHVTINRQTGIPCIDIIDTRQDGESGFFKWWHTTGDTLDKIDRRTLKAVGDALANFIAEF